MTETFFAGRERSYDAYNTGAPVTTPFWDVIGAAAGSTWTENPGVAAYRWGRRRLADNAAAQLDPGEEPGWSGRMLTAAEANERFGVQGHLQFTRPMSEYAARELHDLKRRELVRRDALARAEGGVGQWSLRIAASLATGIADPLNVASAFIPVVGPARATAWLAQAGTRLGRVGVAARLGAIEGAAGAAMLEPFNHYFAADEQRDYSMLDSLLSVAFGGGAGAILHGGGRAILDRLRGWSPEAHEAQMRAAIAAVAEGEPVRAHALGRIFGESRRDELLGSAARFGREGETAAPVMRAADGSEFAFVTAASRMGPAPPGEAPGDMDGQIRAFLRGGSPALAGRPDAPPPASAIDANVVIAPERGPDGRILRFMDEATARNASRTDIAHPYPHPDGRGHVLLTPVRAEVAHDPKGGVRTFETEADAASAATEARLAAGGKATEARADDWRPVPIGPAEAAPYVLARGPSTELDRLRRSQGMVALPQRAEGFVPPPSSSEVRAMLQTAARQAIRPEVEAGVRAAEDAWARVAGENPELRPGVEVPREIAEQVAEIDRMLTEHLRAGRITEADLADVRAAEAAEAHARERAKGYEAAAACLIANGAV